MTITFDDFIKSVEEDNLAFVKDIHALFLNNGCKLEIKEAKQGYVVTYAYTKNKKRVSLMNYVFRKSGMMVRIYPMCRKTPSFSYGDIRRFHRIYASN